MKTHALSVLLLLTFGSIFHVNADPHVAPSPKDYFVNEDVELSNGRVVPAGTRWYNIPDIERLQRELAEGSFKGDIEWARLVSFGYNLMTHTYYTIGEGRKDGRPPLAKGNVMSCSNCHTRGGTVPYAWPFFRTVTYFGLRENGDEGVMWGNLGYKRDTRTRARDCGLNCGGQVIIPEDSFEMDALVAWLTVVRDGIYEGEGILIPEFKTKKDASKIMGARVPLIAGVLDMKADPDRGAKLYKWQCASCHEPDGSGLWGAPDGYHYPPLAGDNAFSNAGGPLMIPVGGSFIARYMPFNSPNMSKQAALDIMAYLVTLPRSSRWWQDHYFEHNPCGRPAFLPLHIGVVPKGYPFSKEQTQFGPWREIAEWLVSDTCKSINPQTQPVLSKDFNVDKSH